MDDRKSHTGNKVASSAEVGLADLRERLRSTIEPVVSNEFLDLVDVQYVNSGGRWMLRVLIDKPGGVNVDDCANLSRRISDALDTDDVIPQRYYLEVSSPGVERLLKNEKDFARFCGKGVAIRTFAPVGGQKVFSGVIEDCGEGSVTIRTKEGELLTVPLSSIERANLKFELWSKKDRQGRAKSRA